MREMAWLKRETGEQILLVKRDIYDLYTVMTVQEFSKTEPYVEALASYHGNRLVALVRRDKGECEMYYEANAPATALFSIAVRKEAADV